MSRTEGIIIPTTNTILGNVDTTSNVENALKVAHTALEGSSTILVSHDFCDKTTWYSESIRIEQETLTNSGDYLTYNFSKTYLIDLCHGKVPYEHRSIDTYKTIIYINDIEQTTNYSINYKNGTVTFESSQEGNIIKATYSYADGSGWSIEPLSGKILKLIGTEVKFAKNCDMGDNQKIIFQIYVNNQPYGSPTIYNNILDFVKCSMEAPTIIPAFGNIQNDIIRLPFNYITSKDLKSSQLTKIRIYVNDDNEMTGEFGCVVAHCLSVTETI